jgi:hypothetical protein
MTTLEYLHTPETVLPRELAYGVLRVADSPVVRPFGRQVVGSRRWVPSRTRRA